MASRVAAKQDTRTALLQVGMEIMTEKGYTNTGIQEVLHALNVPKGSFYHYFDNKENFAVEIIRYCDQIEFAEIERVMRDTAMRPIERLQAYCESGKRSLVSKQCRKCCLIGNLSQEMSDQSEVLRAELSAVMKRRREIFAECIAEGQAAGEITRTATSEELAELFSSAWSGALMHAKTVKNTAPVDVVIDVLFNEVFKP